MRTKLNLDVKLIKETARLSGMKEKTALVHRGLKALIACERSRRLAALGGTQPGFRPPRRRRPAR